MENTVLKDLVRMLVDDDEESGGEDFLNLLMESSDEEEILTKVLHKTAPRKHRNRKQRYLNESVLKYSEDEFKKHFRINRELFWFLCKRFEKCELYTELRPDKRLSAAKHLAVFLWFAGHETSAFRDLTERFGLALSSVSRVINRVTDFLSGLANEIIVWPDEKRKLEISDHFKKKFRIPRVIGAISLIRVTIEPLKEKYSTDYVDSNGHVSICLQAICDDNGKFLDVFIGFPGSSDEDRVFKNSFIYPELEKLCSGYYIVGDTNYPCMKNLLTPYTEKSSFAQKLYNRQLGSSRTVIDNAFKQLKERFCQLEYCKLKGIKKICHFIRACCVLHNLVIQHSLDFVHRIQGLQRQINITSDEVSELEGRAARDAVCEELVVSGEPIM